MTPPVSLVTTDLSTQSAGATTTAFPGGDDDVQWGESWLVAVSEAAAKDAGVPAELLGEYLPMLAAATVAGRRPHPRDLDAVGALGRRAAEQGIPTSRVVNLYLSAAWRLWRELPKLSRSDDSETVRAAEAVLRVVDDAVAALVEGYQAAQRQMIRREVSLRRELVDDLIRGDADVAGLLERAEPFGLDLGQLHMITLAAPSQRLPDTEIAVSSLERTILDHFGDRDVLVASKEGLLVVLSPATPRLVRRRGAAADDLATLVHRQLEQLAAGSPWRVASGRPYPGAYGVARSYEEARDAISLAGRLRLDAPIVRIRDFLVYRVLVRDHVAIRDLVHAVLGPLLDARGGPEPLLETLEAYFAAGEVATEAARRLHLSVRAVTYRLDRVKEITGHDLADPTDRFTLYTAVLGARLLGWPDADAVSG
jgi:sugar diacid utilization regulator